MGNAAPQIPPVTQINLSICEVGGKVFLLTPDF